MKSKDIEKLGAGFDQIKTQLETDRHYRKEFEGEQEGFALSELLLALSEGADDVSIRKLAERAGLSKNAVQKLRSGESKDIRLSNFLKIAAVYGWQITLERGKEKIPLGI